MPNDTITRESTFHRKLVDGDEAPDIHLINTIAELDDVDMAELPRLYLCISEMVGHLFDSPPDTEAQAELTFSYAGYRITVYQDGHAVFQRLRET